jgi:hypothetical protein
MKRLWVILFVINSLWGQKELGSFSISKDCFLYQNPDIKSKRITTIKGGSFVIALDTLNQRMIKLLYMGKKGWVDIDALNLSKEAQSKLLNKEKQKEINIPLEPAKQEADKNNIAPKKKNKVQTKLPNIKEVETKSSKPANKTVKASKAVNKIIAESNKKNSNNTQLILIIIALSISTIALLYFFIKKSILYKKTRKKYDPIISIDEAVEKSKAELESMKSDYDVKKGIYTSLIKEINKLSDDIEIMKYGIYEPKFDFDTSDKFKIEIKSIREKQKNLVRNKKAVLVHTTWEIGGSKVEGRKMTTRMTRIALRAFNGEADNIISKVKWNNLDSSDSRLDRSRDAINKMLETVNMEISYQYYDLKEKELWATHEYNEKKHDEKEERREKLAQEREEKKVLLEAKRAKNKAEKDEAEHERALEIARKELGLLSGNELKEKNNQIEKLEEQLKEALERKERAMSMAQLTKQGHVYVISNIGSFGEGIYKIGLTRRLEPMDRVKELGDASVPFLFDLHAMIFSEDAPALEKKLHEVFHEKRVNMVNNRKEFFSVSLEEIEEEAKKVIPQVEFYNTVESREYRETLAVLKSKEDQVDKLEKKLDKFPDSI